MSASTAPNSSLTVREIVRGFVAEIGGVDLRAPLAPSGVTAIQRAFDRYPVVVFHGQPLTDEQQIAFAANFGIPDPGGYSDRHKARRLQHDVIADASNLDESGAVRTENDPRGLAALANQLWHTDSSFKEPPGAYSMLSARAIPTSGGETEFSDMRAAYDALPPEMQARIADYTAPHSINNSRRLLGVDLPDRGACLRPLVHTHAPSKRKSLFLASHASHIVGLPVAEGRLLLYDLMEHATQAQFVYRHVWAPADFVIWDNRCTMHRGRPYDLYGQVRDLRRVTTQDETGTLLINRG